MAMAPLLLSIFFFLLTCFSLHVHSSASHISYEDHCASIVPVSNLHHYDTPSFFIPLGPILRTVYISGGDRILGGNPYSQQNSIFVRLSRPKETDLAGLFKVGGSISIRSTIFYYRPHPSSVTINLDGFWSASTGRLCMVGSGSDYSRGGKARDLDFVFKLNNLFNSSKINSVASGSLERLSSKEGLNPETFPVLMLPRFNYELTLDSEESKNEFSHVGISGDAEKGLPEFKHFCSPRVRRAIRKLHLEYSGDCNSPRNCTPFSGISGYLPPFMSLNLIECTFTKKNQLRVLISFNNHTYEDFRTDSFNPQTMLVGEGWWDEKKNHLHVVACHFLGLASSSFSSVHVGDCSVRLRLRFPSAWSIKDTSTVVGQIWSNKTVKDPGYFKGITFRKEDGQNVGLQGLKYAYTQQDKVKNLCPRQKINNKGSRYPNPHSYDMKFDMSVGESIGKVAWGSSAPLSVGDQFYNLGFSTESVVVLRPSSSLQVPADNFIKNGWFNISYKISMSLHDNRTLRDDRSLFHMSGAVKISAEGVYDAGTGNLCMVGCRNLPSPSRGIPMAHPVDCEILVKFQFPPLHSRHGSYIVGRIESTRKKSDPLYFQHLHLRSAAYYKRDANDTVKREDMEIIMVVISTTLYCVLVGFQLYHVKKNPQVLPFISLTMLSILTLYHMIPLVLNFEALFTKNHNTKNFVLSNVAWLESNEITIRLITMVAFLMQFRLLQLTWSARKSTDGSRDSLWIAEKEAVYVTLPLYAAGFLIAMVKGRNSNTHYLVTVSTKFQQASSWEVLKSYKGLIFDGFLLPQIMMNIFSNMRETALSVPFYVGTSFLRLLPHAYDLYRTSNYGGEEYSESYMYADPSADFYSTGWDIAIVLGCFLFAVIIYLQQRFRGSLILLPSRLSRSGTYETVPKLTQAEEEEEEERPEI